MKNILKSLHIIWISSNPDNTVFQNIILLTYNPDNIVLKKKRCVQKNEYV